MAANDRQVAGAHYLSPIQHWDYVLANDIPYLEAQVIKYLTRWRKKNGLEDILKAQHYLEKLIEVETAKLKEQHSDTERVSTTSDENRSGPREDSGPS